MSVRATAAAVAVALCAVAQADRPPGERPPGQVLLSIEDALRRAEDASPLMTRARAARDVVTGRRVGARVVLPSNPWISFSGGAATEPNIPAGTWMVAHVEQSIEIGGQRGARIREVEAAIKVASDRERFARVETRAQVRIAYIGALLAERYLETAQSREAVVRRLVDAIKARVRAGSASDVDLHLAEIELGRVEVERRDAELVGAQQRAELSLLAAVPAGTAIQLTSPLPEVTAQLPALEKLIAAAYAARADLQALAHTTEQIDREISRLRREAVPNPALFVEVQQQFPNQLYLGAGVGLQVPVARWNQGPLAIARAERSQSEVELGLVSREVGREVALAYRAAEQRRAQAEIYEKEVVPAAESNVDLIADGWRAGKFDLYRVMVAARVAAEAERERLAIVGSMWQALIELDRATGTP